ncbi:MAG: putative glycoside hydrolase [Patescibacteria group bacterium]|jgi:hypothetical protein
MKRRRGKGRKILAKLTNVLIPLVILVMVFVFFSWHPASVKSSQYPRLANYFLKTPITDDEAVKLAKWDLVILGMQAQETSPEQIKKIKQLNPEIKILAYVASQEFPRGHYDKIESVNGPWHKLLAGMSDGWWLMRSNGEHFSSWPGNWSINVTNQAPVNASGQRWNTYLAQFMHDQVMSTGLWDGIFYDNVWGSASWVGDGDMDINRDGAKDNPTWLNTAWNEGMRTMLGKSRQLEGPDKIILGNGTNDYKDFLNGRLIENAYAWKDWVTDQYAYTDYMSYGQNPKSTVVNNNTANTGDWQNYRLMRYGLASTMMNNGYYSFDYGTQSHGELWWYDEYDVDLGQPISAAYNTDTGSSEIAPGLWRRDYEKGVVFLNSGKEGRIITLGDEEFEKISGKQDPTVNDGSRVNYVSLSGADGVIMYRPLSEIIGSPFVNGTFVRIFSATGERLRGGFYTYKRQYPGLSQIIIIDIDADGEMETIVAGRSGVDIYSSNGVKERTFYPYGEKYNKGVNIAVGDFGDDGTKKIITGTENGGGPHIRIFNNQGRLLSPGFFAYGTDYRGGVNVALGDLNGDGVDEIVAGAGVSGGPQIRIFNKDGKLLSAGWFAYDKKFRGGVNVSVGDLNGDGKAEIVTAPGFGGSPEVKVWDSRGKQIGKSFMAFDPSNKDGVEVLLNDINYDGSLEIIPTSPNVF